MAYTGYKRYSNGDSGGTNGNMLHVSPGSGNKSTLMITNEGPGVAYLGDSSVTKASGSYPGAALFPGQSVVIEVAGNDENVYFASDGPTTVSCLQTGTHPY